MWFLTSGSSSTLGDLHPNDGWEDDAGPNCPLAPVLRCVITSRSAYPQTSEGRFPCIRSHCGLWLPQVKRAYKTVDVVVGISSGRPAALCA